MWTEPILHVDMDSFFVEVERLSDPALRGRPVAVGGTGKRGVIASASYEARSHGVSSAQPTAVALRLCPQLVVVSPRHESYGAISEEVFAIFRAFTPLVEGLSLDEAFLDVSGLRRHFDSPVAVGNAIRGQIRTALGLPASVGVAPTKFVAKLASKQAKPDGLRHIAVDEQLSFLHGLDVAELWGVGPATLAGLQRLGISTVGDLASSSVDSLSVTLGRAQGEHLHRLANGIDERPVEPESSTKQVSVEETYDEDLQSRELVVSAVMALCQRLSTRLRRGALEPRTISLKVRFDDFTTLTRSTTRPSGTDDARAIFHAARELLAGIPADRPIRLLGVAGSGFESSGEAQQILFAADDDSWDKVSKALGEVEERFGPGTLTPARLIRWRIDGRDPVDD